MRAFVYLGTRLSCLLYINTHFLTSGAMSTLVTTTASGIWRAQAMEMCSFVMTCVWVGACRVHGMRKI